MTDQELLQKGTEALRLNMDASKSDLFMKYMKTLIQWNNKINLTSLKSHHDIIIKHFIDSISSAAYQSYSDKKVIDIGSGGGFPGIPLKILYPKMQMTFVDSSKKKARAIEEMCEEIQIKGFHVLGENIENVARMEEHRGSYDIAVARAVSSFSTLLEYMIPMIKVGGKAIIYKGPDVEKEVENSTRSLMTFKSRIVKNVYFKLPFTDEGRRILVVEKEGKTEDKYPRGVGKPRKSPL